MPSNELVATFTLYWDRTCQNISANVIQEENAYHVQPNQGSNT